MEKVVKKNSYFPIFYDITGWNICFVGAGRVAERRIKTLQMYPCHIFIISEEATKEIQKMAEQGEVVWVVEKIKEGNLDKMIHTLKQKYPEYFSEQKNFQMMLACTDSRKVNQMICEYCREEKILVNIADNRHQSEFHFPGIIKKEDIVIGVTGNGENHEKVKKIMDRLREVFL